MTGTFVAIGGLAGSLFSRGFDDVNIPGWHYRWFSHNNGRIAGEWAREKPGPIILAWHSAGASQDDDFAEAYGRPIDLAIAVDSWLPGQKVDPRYKRVISVVAEDGGRFHVQGGNVIDRVVIADSTHTTVDDAKQLHDLILAEAKLLNRDGGSEEDMNHEKFMHWTPIFMRTFMSDFDASVEDAAAVFGNAGHESYGYEKLQEMRPTKPGSRGGYGIMQWTGSRRVEYEAYCARHGYDPADMEVNYKHLFNELTKTAEKRVLPLLKNAETLDEKVKVVMDVYLRPGVKHLDSRQRWAKRALEAWENANAVIPAPDPEPPQTGEIGDLKAALKTLLPSLTEAGAEQAIANALAIVYLQRDAPPGKGAIEMNRPALEAGFSLPESKGSYSIMGNYSKLIGSLVGGVVGILVAKNILPPEFNTPEMIAALSVVCSGIATYIFPANRPA